jgi:hypothetical protein
MTTKDRYRKVQRAARCNVREKLSQANRLDLWGRVVSPNQQLVIKTSVECGFTRADTEKLVFLLKETLATRAI